MALPAEGGLADSKPRSEFYTSPAKLALLAGVPVLVALWALLSPGLVLSHEMTWDLRAEPRGRGYRATERDRTRARRRGSSLLRRPVTVEEVPIL